MVDVPILKFVPDKPANLSEVLEAQVRRLIEIGAQKEVGVEEGKFLDDATRVVSEFVYSAKLAKRTQLDRVWLMHYGVRDQHLAEAGGVHLIIKPEKYTLFDGAVLPNGLRVVQEQLGPKYNHCSPRDIRLSHDALEQLGLPVEGLTAFLYWGKKLLQESKMQFPGADMTITSTLRTP